MNALPAAALENFLNVISPRIAVALWLGVAVCHPHQRNTEVFWNGLCFVRLVSKPSVRLKMELHSCMCDKKVGHW